MAAKISTEIEIEAPASKIWKILTDFESYRGWNPFIPKIEGEPVEGTQLKVTLEPPGAGQSTLKPTLLKVERDVELRWKGRLWIAGLFDGEHVFRLAPQGPGRVLFIQEESFSGFLSGLILSMIRDSTLEGFREMNKALKFRAENVEI